MIYFIEAMGANRIKIGLSADRVSARLATLRHQSPFPLKLLGVIDGCIKREKLLHRAFHEERVWREWFEATDTLRLFVRDVVASDADQETVIEQLLLKRNIERDDFDTASAQVSADLEATIFDVAKAWIAKHGVNRTAQVTGRSKDTIREYRHGNIRLNSISAFRMMAHDYEPFVPLFGSDLRGTGAVWDKSQAFKRIERELPKSRKLQSAVGDPR